MRTLLGFVGRAVGVSIVVYVWLDLLSYGILSRILEQLFEDSQQELAKRLLHLAERRSGQPAAD